jgi:hypothetical protein
MPIDSTVFERFAEADRDYLRFSLPSEREISKCDSPKIHQKCIRRDFAYSHRRLFEHMHQLATLARRLSYHRRGGDGAEAGEQGKQR